MKALIYIGPENMKVEEIAEPVTADDEVKIKVKYCGICGSDVHGYLGISGRRIPPMIMGHEFSGMVVETGNNVENIKIGDRVTVQPVDFCGECKFCISGFTNMCLNKRFYGVMDVNGAMTEYICVPEKLVYKLPDSMSYEEGAMIEPLSVAYSAVKKAGEITGKDILIVGAGTIGLMLLNVIKTMKPNAVYVSDLNDHRLDIAKSFGADYTINPSRDNNGDTLNNKIDIAFEAVGATSTVGQAMQSLKNCGTAVWVGNSAKIIQLDMQNVVTRQLKVYGTYIYTHKEFGESIEFLSNNKLDLKQLITSIISLDDGPKIFNELAKSPDNLVKCLIKGDDD